MYITKEGTFDASHRLFGYDGACSNIHGHTWKVQATYAGDVSKGGMVIDFKTLKRDLESVLSLFDHKIILFEGDPLVDVLKAAEALFTHPPYLHTMEVLPTAEHIAERILCTLRGMSRDGSSYNVLSVKVWESETSFVEVW